MLRIETVDQPRFEAAAAGQLDHFDKRTRRRDDFRNMRIWSDHERVLSSPQKEFEAKLGPVYVDPPFDVGADFKVDGISSEMISLARRLCYPSSPGEGCLLSLHTKLTTERTRGGQMARSAIRVSCALFLMMGITSIPVGDVHAADRDAEIEMLLKRVEDLEKKRDDEIEVLKKRIHTLEEEQSVRREREENSPSGDEDSALALFEKTWGDREFKIGFRTQGWYQFVEDGSDSGSDDLNDFMIRRAYLYLKGKVTEEMGFFAHIAADRVGQDGLSNSGMGLGTGIAVRDAWINYEFNDALTAQLGRMYVPFTRNYGTTSTFAMMPLDLTFAQGGVRGGIFYASKVGRDDGLVLWGNPFDGRIQYRVGVFEGVEDSTNENDSLRYVGRVSLNLLEPETSWFNKGTYLGEKKVLALGLGFDYQDDLMLGGSDDETSFGWTADLFYDHPVGDGAVTLEAAYIRIRNATQNLAFSRLSPGGDAHLYYVQGGYLLPGTFGAGRIQPYFRWEHVAVDSASDTMIPCAGINYFLKGHDAKLTLDWSLLRQGGSSSSFPTTSTFTGDDQHMVTLQASVGF